MAATDMRIHIVTEIGGVFGGFFQLFFNVAALLGSDFGGRVDKVNIPGPEVSQKLEHVHKSLSGFLKTYFDCGPLQHSGLLNLRHAGVFVFFQLTRSNDYMRLLPLY